MDNFTGHYSVPGPSGQNNQITDDNNAVGSLAGVPLGAQSLNAMMAGAAGVGVQGTLNSQGLTLPQANNGASLTPVAQSAFQYFQQGAGGVPVNLTASPAMFTQGPAAAMAGRSGMAGMGGMTGMGVGGMAGMAGMPGMGLQNTQMPGTLGLQSNAIQNPSTFMLFSANSGNMPAAINQLSQAANGMNQISRAPIGGLVQDQNNDTLSPQDKNLVIPSDVVSSKPAIPTSLLNRYWNIQPSLHTGLEDSGGANTYRDHALLQDEESLRRATEKGKSGGGSNFPAKLHEILSRTDISDIIDWSPHGRSWRVYKPKAFEEKVIPQYFRHCKYNSFTRQVNGWGFRRITQGPDHNAYFHELFLRGLPHLCKRMRRLTSGSHRNDNSSNIEPDFYSISKVSPLPPSDNGVTPKITSQAVDRNDQDEDNTGNVDVNTGDGKKDEIKLTTDTDAVLSDNPLATVDLMNQTQNDLPSLDLARQQFFQAQYLNAMNSANQGLRTMNNNNGLVPFQSPQDNIQQHLLAQQAQQALLNSLQSQQGALTGMGGVTGMSLQNTQMSFMPSGMGGGAVGTQALLSANNQNQFTNMNMSNGQVGNNGGNTLNS